MAPKGIIKSTLGLAAKANNARGQSLVNWAVVTNEQNNGHQQQ
jgi:hypothetical protein